MHVLKLKVRLYTQMVNTYTGNLSSPIIYTKNAFLIAKYWSILIPVFAQILKRKKNKGGEKA